MTRLIVNRGASGISGFEAPCAEVHAFHAGLPGYRPSPLVDAPSLADRLGVDRAWVKDESDRFGLPSFKVLGASWAVAGLLRERFGIMPHEWNDPIRLRERLRGAGPMALVTATDGNHGRGVARVASWCGLRARVFMPAGTVQARIEAIEGEGAEVIVVDGDYDRAVEAAAGEEGPGVWLIQDTAWPGYEEIPRRIVEGYSTIFREIEQQLAASGGGHPDLVAVQIGVGSLAASAALCYRSRGARPLLLGVEPGGAACAFASVRAGRAVSLPGPHRSALAGLNCGTLSSLAWPLLRDGFNAFVVIDDERAFEAMRLLARDRVASGESGAAGAAGCIELACAAEVNLLHRELGLGAYSRVLVISTEGITDPGIYRTVMGER